MFAMVLAIGLLVDDAIVVVENVERVMREEDLPPREATRKSMDQITGALIGIALVLSAVFVPMAFFGGSTGVIYRQFSVTIVSAMVLSVLVALMLTPALCATILRRAQGPCDADAAAVRLVQPAASTRGHDGLLATARAASSGAVCAFSRSSSPIVVAHGAAVRAGCRARSCRTKIRAFCITSVQLPAGATQDRTLRVLAAGRAITISDAGEGRRRRRLHRRRLRLRRGRAERRHGVRQLKDFGRAARRRAQSAQAPWPAAPWRAFARSATRMVFALAPPAIQGFGNSTGFDIYLQDVNGAGMTR